MNSVITSAGFRNPEIFLTVQSTVPFPSCVSSLFMFFINLGMILSSLCAGLMNTFLSSLQKKKPGSLFLPCLILSLKPWLPSCTLLVFVSGKSAASVMKMLTANICAFTSHTLKTEMTGMPFFLKQPLTF